VVPGPRDELGRQLAERRVQHLADAMSFLYVDGHVRAYHGKRELPKTHVARMRIAMPATTDYWINDAAGEPLFVVTAEANAGLVKMLPTLCTDIRALVGDRRVTIVFDRGGWSPRLFQKLVTDGFDILTYRKGRTRKRLRWEFREHRAALDGRQVGYQLADHGIRLLGGKLELREVVRLSDDGCHQTQVVTSRRDLPAIEVAYRMFERWRQENFFKYLRDEYALDALVDYQLEPADPHRDVPNPARAVLDAKLRAARAQIISLSARYGIEAIANREDRRRTMRGFKIATASLARPVREALRRYTALEARRAKVPLRVPVSDVVDGDVVKLSVERKHLTDVIKMVAYQAETDLVRRIAPHYHRADDEARTLVQSMLANAGDIAVTATELRVTFTPLSSPHRTAALAALCAELDALAPRFPRHPAARPLRRPCPETGQFARRVGQEVRISVPTATVPTTVPTFWDFHGLGRDQLHEGRRRLAHLLHEVHRRLPHRHRHLPPVLQVLVLPPRPGKRSNHRVRISDTMAGHWTCAAPTGRDRVVIDRPRS
jgi:hypothetical protein